MKLDYKIMWVEDKIGTQPFKSLKESISEHLEGEFFEVTIETAEDVKEFKNKFVGDDAFDLIITDLNLNEGHGSDVINYIRDEKHVMTEVFFYSANGGLKDSALLNSNRITFHSLDDSGFYNELKKAIIDLIDLTIARFQHIVTMRGMIMHETSSLDVQLKKLVSKTICTGDSERILEKIKDKYTEYLKDRVEKFSGMDGEENILPEIGSYHMNRALCRNIKSTDIKEVLQEYQRDIIKVRNQFAHAVFDKEKQVFEGDKGMRFDVEECKRIRKNISKHQKNLANLDQELRQD